MLKGIWEVVESIVAMSRGWVVVGGDESGGIIDGSMLMVEVGVLSAIEEAGIGIILSGELVW